MPNVVTATISYYQEQLARDERFIRRLQNRMMNYAIVVMGEALTTANHDKRVAFAQSVRQSPEHSARLAAFIMVTGAGFNNSFTINDGVPSTTLDDTQLLTQVTNMWDTLSGVETGA